MTTQRNRRGSLRLLILLGILFVLGALTVWAGGAAPAQAAVPVAGDEPPVSSTTNKEATATPTGVPTKVGGMAPLTPYPTATCPPEGWAAGTDYPIRVRRHAATVLGTRLYVFGGWSDEPNTNGPVAYAYKFSPVSGWSAVPFMPKPLLDLGVTSDSDRIYIQGGMNGQYVPDAGLWAYNPNVGSYQTLASAPVATYGHALVYLNGNLYRIGGNLGGTTYTAAVYKYDISINTWTAVASYPVAAQQIFAVVHNGYIYAGGGYNGIALAKTYRYNPATNSWNDSSVHDLPSGRQRVATAILNGHWLVSGGLAANGNGTTSTIALDLAAPANAWDYRANLPTVTYSWAGGTIGRLFYGVAGSQQIVDPTTDVWRYSDGCP
jgi:N-acetylneuraminic acid mutarotase